MLQLLVSFALAGGTEVDSRPVQGFDLNASAEVRRVGKRPELYVADRDEQFICFSGFPAFFTRGALARMAETVTEATAAARAGQRMRFGRAITSIVSSNSAGFCNLSASTEYSATGEPLVALGFVYNRACFGSAGCNTDHVVLIAAPAVMDELAAALQWGSTKP